MAEDIPDNIDRFNRITLALLSELYAAFPEPLDVDPHVLGINASGQTFEGGDPDEQRALASVWMDSATSTIDWLRREGFITGEEGSLEIEAVGLVLTEKGLNAIGHTPKSLIQQQKGKSVGDSIKDYLKGGARAAISEAVKQILDAGLRITFGG